MRSIKHCILKSKMQSLVCHHIIVLNITIRLPGKHMQNRSFLSLTFQALINRDLSHLRGGRPCQLLALEGTRATSISTHLSTCRVCVGEHILFICMVLIALSKSLFLPLLTHSIGEISPPSGISQELFSFEKVRKGKLPPLRHL